MSSAPLVVYEHQRLVVATPSQSLPLGRVAITQAQWEALARYEERTGTGAFTVGRRWIGINHHVGYLDAEGLRLEILPKVGRVDDGDWRGLLCHMLAEVHDLRISPQRIASLATRGGDLYAILIDRFLALLEGHLLGGLPRDYREFRQNERYMRGRLEVQGQVRHNLVHKERLFVRFAHFDGDTPLSRVLYRALEVVKGRGPWDAQRMRARRLQARFPHFADRRWARAEVSAVTLDRRTRGFEETLTLAQMLIATERPDLRWGTAPTVALLFDMNALFEAYILRVFRRLPGAQVRAQTQKRFWRGAGGATRHLRPDLLITVEGTSGLLVLDTKWKIPTHGRPSGADLRQLYAYLKIFGGARGLLLYPRHDDAQTDGMGKFEDGALPGGIAFVSLMKDGQPSRDHVVQELAALLHQLGGQDDLSQPRSEGGSRL